MLAVLHASRLFAVLAKSVRNDCRHGNTPCTAFGRRLDIIPLNVQMNVASATFDAKGAVSGSFLRDDAYWTKVPQAGARETLRKLRREGEIEKI